MRTGLCGGQKVEQNPGDAAVRPPRQRAELGLDLAAGGIGQVQITDLGQRGPRKRQPDGGRPIAAGARSRLWDGKLDGLPASGRRRRRRRSERHGICRALVPIAPTENLGLIRLPRIESFQNAAVVLAQIRWGHRPDHSPLTPIFHRPGFGRTVRRPTDLRFARTDGPDLEVLDFHPGQADRFFPKEQSFDAARLETPAGRKRQPLTAANVHRMREAVERGLPVRVTCRKACDFAAVAAEFQFHCLGHRGYLDGGIVGAITVRHVGARGACFLGSQTQQQVRTIDRLKAFRLHVLQRGGKSLSAGAKPVFQPLPGFLTRHLGRWLGRALRAGSQRGCAGQQYADQSRPENLGAHEGG